MLTVLVAVAEPLLTVHVAAVDVPSVLPVHHDPVLPGADEDEDVPDGNFETHDTNAHSSQCAAGGGTAACHGMQWHVLEAQDMHAQAQVCALGDEEAEEEELAWAWGQEVESHRDADDGSSWVHHENIAQDGNLEQHEEVAVGVEQEQEEEGGEDGREQDMEVEGAHDPPHYQIEGNLVVECDVPAQEVLAGHNDMMRGKSSGAHAASSHAHAELAGHHALGCGGDLERKSNMIIK